TGWAILDYYMRRKAAYYWFRRAAAPLKVIVRQLNGHLITRLVNDTLEPANVTVDLGWWRLDGTEKVVVSYPVDVQANGMVEVASAKTPTASERDPRQWLYAAVLRGRDGVAMDQSVWLERPYRELALEKPAIKAVPIADNWLEISSPVFAHAVHTEDHGHEVLSDNWFDLLPGVPVRVRLAPGIEPASIHFKTLGSPNDN
ncbi:MAG: hypothetical protein M1608_03835, partial [Candidatus Omnitrophica bacterium]|nr:hypothetical protein [Candidatus Omnitrophota bacterium]